MSLGETRTSLFQVQREVQMHNPNQKFSREVHLVEVRPNGGPGKFDAFVDDRLVVKSSHQPFLQAARTLLESGVDGNSWLIMRHARSQTDSLKSKVVVAARLAVEECARGDGPRFGKHVPWSPAAAPMRANRTR
jgi:hypothetical protein